MSSVITYMLVLLSGSYSLAALTLNCSNENTYLKVNEFNLYEVHTEDESIPKLAELYLNLKDQNRILNLPEVIIEQKPLFLKVSERMENVRLDLTFIQPQNNVELDLGKKALISVALDGQILRNRNVLECK